MCPLLQEHSSKPKRHHENGRKGSEIYVQELEEGSFASMTGANNEDTALESDQTFHAGGQILT